MEINRTILIADASEDFRSVLVEAIRLEEGLDVVAQTGDGLEAIQLIREWKPDVLVMDLVLGRADGFDVLDSVKGIPRSTLILSSFARGCMADEVSNRGGDYYMMKPCRISSVVERIRLLASKPWDEEGPDGEMTAMARQNLESSVTSIIHEIIEVAWDRGDLDTLQKYFGFTVSNAKGKPTNSEFIAMIADRLVLQRRQG